MEKEDLKLIINAIEGGKCLAFLGAGACTSFKKNEEEVPGFPPEGNWREHWRKNASIPMEMLMIC